MIERTYGGFNLQDPVNGIWTTKSDIYSASTNMIQADSLAEADGARVVKQQRGTKSWTDQGVLRSTTRAGLEAKIDAFKTAMTRKNQAYDLEYGGGIRRYLANVKNLAILDSYGLTSVDWNVEFFCADGVGWNLAVEELLASTDFTSGSMSWTKNSLGSYQVEPLIAVAFGAITGGTAKTVSISNGQSLRGISITRTWVSGDLLEIDCLKKTVLVNNQPVDFGGQFPVWEPGTSIVNYLDDLTTRSGTVLISYTPRWL